MPSDKLTTVRFTVLTLVPQVEGFAYLWCKTVRGFDATKHCAKCLEGEYQTAFGLRAEPAVEIALGAYAEGDLLYFCGVAKPYRHANNFHLAGRVSAGASARAAMWTGDVVEVLGLESIAIDAGPASLAFPGRAKAYLTCRNYQFGAQVFAHEKPAGFAGGLSCEAV